MLPTFRRRPRHPFFPSLKLAPAESARAFSPALYGPFEELARAGDSGARAGRGVFPICRPASPFLSDDQRDELWEKFQVPIYALMVDGRDRIVGFECEAQDGLHIREDYAARLPFNSVETRLCECGRPGPRLMPGTDVQAKPEPAPPVLVHAPAI